MGDKIFALIYIDQWYAHVQADDVQMPRECSLVAMCPRYHKESGGHLNTKMSYQYRDPHFKDKAVLGPSYL